MATVLIFFFLKKKNVELGTPFKNDLSAVNCNGLALECGFVCKFLFMRFCLFCTLRAPLCVV